MTRILFIAVISLLAVGYTHAAEVTLSCTPPTKNEDGTNITGAITYTAHYGVNASTLSETVNLGSTCGGKITIAAPPPGQSITRYFGVRAHVNGVQSELSNVVSKMIATPYPTPNPPTNLTVQEGQQAAYVIKQTRDNISLVAVGQVPAGTQCNGMKGVIADGKSYHVVPREVVSWAGSVQSEIVVAACS